MHRFISSSCLSGEIKPDSLWFVFQDDHILLRKKGDTYAIPRYADFLPFEDTVEERYYIGSYEGTDCFAVLLSRPKAEDGFEPVMRRKAYYLVGERDFALAGRAYQTVFFHLRHRFCGACGAPMESMKEMVARRCAGCGAVYHPQQAPAVIMAVTRGDTILLARSPRFRPSMYSVLAGFVEPGETLEDTVKREVREECGIEVKNITYFSSRPWPFPNSLMIGFTAEHESGEIKIDENEIIDAGWYTPGNLPEVPDRVSIAGRLVNHFIEERRHSEAE